MLFKRNWEWRIFVLLTNFILFDDKSDILCLDCGDACAKSSNRLNWAHLFRLFGVFTQSKSHSFVRDWIEFRSPCVLFALHQTFSHIFMRCIEVIDTRAVGMRSIFRIWFYRFLAAKRWRTGRGESLGATTSANLRFVSASLHAHFTDDSKNSLFLFVHLDLRRAAAAYKRLWWLGARWSVKCVYSWWGMQAWVRHRWYCRLSARSFPTTCRRKPKKSQYQPTWHPSKYLRTSSTTMVSFQVSPLRTNGDWRRRRRT